jgi:hypothetical protein
LISVSEVWQSGRPRIILLHTLAVRNLANLL